MKTMAITKMAAVLLLLRRQEDRNQVRRLLRLLSVANRSTLRVIARDGQPFWQAFCCSSGVKKTEIRSAGSCASSPSRTARHCVS